MSLDSFATKIVSSRQVFSHRNICNKVRVAYDNVGSAKCHTIVVFLLMHR